jgi:hypothetical protein
VYRRVTQTLDDQGKKDGECLARYTRADVENEQEPKLPVFRCLQGISLGESVPLHAISVVLMGHVQSIVLDDTLGSKELLLGIEEPG